jgi:hypothetical protein
LIERIPFSWLKTVVRANFLMSTPRRKAKLMVMSLRESVRERYAVLGLDQEQFEELVETRTEELELLVDQIAYDNRVSMTTAWTNSHNSQPPDFMEQVGINNQAQQSAVETVLSQLWEGYNEDQEPELETTPDWTPHNDTGPLPPTDPEIEELALQLWPERANDMRFLARAEMLLTERDEAGLPLPETAADPLTRQVAETVLADLAASDAMHAKLRTHKP